MGRECLARIVELLDLGIEYNNDWSPAIINEIFANDVLRRGRNASVIATALYFRNGAELSCSISVVILVELSSLNNYPLGNGTSVARPPLSHYTPRSLGRYIYADTFYMRITAFRFWFPPTRKANFLPQVPAVGGAQELTCTRRVDPCYFRKYQQRESRNW